MKTNTKFSRGLPSSRHLHNPAVRRLNRRQRDAVMFRRGVAAVEAALRRQAETQKAETAPHEVPWHAKARMWLRRKTGIPW